MHSRQSIIFFLFSISIKYEWKSVNSEIYCLRYQDICCSIHRKMVNEQPYTYPGCLEQLNTVYKLVSLYDKLVRIFRISDNQCNNLFEHKSNPSSIRTFLVELHMYSSISSYLSKKSLFLQILSIDSNSFQIQKYV